MIVRHQLIVKVRLGLNILDTPRPRSMGAQVRRAVKVGTVLEAQNIIMVDDVPYALLVPQNPLKPEWVRVREADSSIEYVDVIDLPVEDSNSEIAAALREIADAIRAQR